ncbi:hypothetical protein BJ741DRAFT_284604 [Chytriomyces cf. hyalinus JEL632]|nr:hypothetical protein BJ741DRAFT_284604 [Chytriomyces cf. hyalinus JEL632]
MSRARGISRTEDCYSTTTLALLKSMFTLSAIPLSFEVTSSALTTWNCSGVCECVCVWFVILSMFRVLAIRKISVRQQCMSLHTSALHHSAIITRRRASNIKDDQLRILQKIEREDGTIDGHWSAHE